MSLGLVGCKVGMTRIFAEDGRSVPVTVLDVSNNRVVQIKKPEVDGYSALQLAFGFRRKTRLVRPLVGHLALAGVESASVLREFALPLGQQSAYALGDLVGVDIFSVGQKVDVTGVSIGKGFAGTIKRHNFSSNRASHGNSRSHNVPGSIGMAQDPGRVFPGKKMSGHLGAVKTTVQNLEVVRVDVERGLLLVKGAVPGSDGGNVVVHPAVKSAN